MGVCAGAQGSRPEPAGSARQRRGRALPQPQGAGSGRPLTLGGTECATSAAFGVCLQIVVPPLPGKALKRQLPFRGDEGIFEESFIEERRQGLEQFINK